jgi:putative phosphoribosyl transferase
MLFGDRRDAGRRLARELAGFELLNPVVLAIPRGGVVVAYEVSRALGAPLDVIIPRKIGAPSNPELAIGALAQDGTLVVDQALILSLGVGEKYLAEETERQKGEITRRLGLYRQGAPAVALEGAAVIVVDDGIATGATVLAALRGLRSAAPAKVILAVPVAPPDTLQRLLPEADKIVCLATPEPFYAVGQFYRHFDQTSDEEEGATPALPARGDGGLESGRKLGCQPVEARRRVEAGQPFGNNRRHLHYQVQTGVLKDEVLHEPTHVDHACDVKIAHRRQDLVHPGPRPESALSDANGPDVLEASQAGVHRHDGVTGEAAGNVGHSVRQVPGVNRFLEGAEDRHVTGGQGLEPVTGQWPQGVPGRSVGADADDNDASQASGGLGQTLTNGLADAGGSP